MSLHWSHELPVVSESHESPLVSLNLMSPDWSRESPVVSMRLMSPYCSHEYPVVSESRLFLLVSISLQLSLSVMNPYWSPLVSESNETHWSHELPVVSLSLMSSHWSHELPVVS